MPRLTPREALRVARCPLCGLVVLDVDAVQAGQLTLPDMLAAMVGHSQTAHPEFVDAFVDEATAQGHLAPPPDGE